MATITAWVALFTRSLHGRLTCLHLFSRQLKLMKPGSPPASYRSATSSSTASAPAPVLICHGRVWGGPCSSPESTAVSSDKSSKVLGEIHQKPAYINEYLFCTQQSRLTFKLE